MTASGRVVVGIDSSVEAAAALRWARDEALIRAATLEVVHAWVPPYPHAGVSTVDSETVKRVGAHLLSSVVDLTLGDDAGVHVVQTLVGGDPATALLDVAEGADLLVVGSRGHGGFAGLLLGSVSSKCLHRARCPVAVVRPAA